MNKTPSKQASNPTTFRMKPEDEAAIAVLQAHLGSPPMSNLLSMGLVELMKKYGLKIPKKASK